MRQHSTRLFLAWAFMVLAAVVSTSASAAPPRYELTVLPILDGSEPQATSINQRGQVTGFVGLKGFIYHDGTMQTFSMVDRGYGGYVFQASINDHGTVAGTASCDSPSDFCNFAFVYRDGKVTTPPIRIGDFGEVSQINNRGQIVGKYYSYWDGDRRAFLRQHGVTVELFPDATDSAAYGINDSGQITGYTSSHGGYVGYVYREGQVRLLGELEPGGGSIGRAINRWGHVTGEARVGTKTHAFRYRNGVMTDLGVLGNGDDATGLAINDAGQVVGSSKRNYDELTWRAFIFTAGHMYDLNALTDRRGGFVLRWAADINNAGQIVGTGAYPGQYGRAFLLTPIRTQAAVP